MPESPGTHAERLRGLIHSLGEMVAEAGWPLTADAALVELAALSADLEAVTREREVARQAEEAMCEIADRYRRRHEAAEERLEATKDALREQAECWLEDERGWRAVLDYFQAQSDADRHDAKELIAAIEQRASTVAANARAALAEDK